MVDGQQHPVIRYLRRLAGAPPGTDGGDAELLRRFALERSQDAFATIVDKHGPMVIGVCRRVLRNPQDAEDAFQATFLVLVRKAGSLRQPTLLASWLYGVAYRTAIKARALAAQRHFHETKAMTIQASSPTAETTTDLQEWLDDEVSRLPAKYRKPLTLCYFAGLTNEEAARRLGCAPGTIFSRLARARQMLRDRLTRRGVVISAAALAGSLTAETTRAAVSANLADATVKAAVVFAAGNPLAAAAISKTVLTLTKGVQQAMFLNTLKIVLAFGSTAAVVGGSGVSLWALAHDSKQAETLANKHPNALNKSADDKIKREQEALKKDDDIKNAELEAQKKHMAELNLKRLLQDRVQAAKMEFETRMQHFEAGRGTQDFMIGASKRLLLAEIDATDKRLEQLDALKAHLERMKKVQDEDQQRFDAGRISIEDLSQSKYYRLEAEIWLERAKMGKVKLDIEIRDRDAH